jgi:hypothetical protein
MAFHGDFTPVLAKHSKHFVLADAIDIGLGRMQRNFDPMRAQIASRMPQRRSKNSAFVLGENSLSASAGRRFLGMSKNSDRQPLSINITSQYGIK